MLHHAMKFDSQGLDAGRGAGRSDRRGADARVRRTRTRSSARSTTVARRSSRARETRSGSRARRAATSSTSARCASTATRTRRSTSGRPTGRAATRAREACFARTAVACPLLLRLEARARGAQARARREKSYTKSLYEGGALGIGEKLREEADELARALAGERDARVVSEAADVVYHLMVGAPAPRRPAASRPRRARSTLRHERPCGKSRPAAQRAK